jgi:capsid assembly protease
MNTYQLQAQMNAQRELWAILPEYLQNVLAESILEDPGAADRQAVARPGQKSGGVAHVPIFGTITHRDSFWSQLFGGAGATVERLTQTLRGLADDPAVSTVLLEIDSPGGTVSGVPELAAEVRALRAKKHVVALANSLAASAAYWIASQADEIVATPEAMIGSIGVFTYHVDYSAQLEQDGVKVTFVSAGKYKTEANPYQPLSDEAQAHLQSLIDDAYGLFVSDVAKGRGVTPATVRSDYGQGRVLTAQDAKAAGMINRIATADETIKRLTGARQSEAQPIDPQANIEGDRLAMLRHRLELAEKI